MATKHTAKQRAKHKAAAAKKVSQPTTYADGSRAEIRDGKLVIVGADGNVIEGAVPFIKGKERGYEAPTPTTTPFETPDDLMAWAQQQQTVEDALWGIDADLGKMTADTEFQTSKLDRDAERAQAQTVDQMAARGLSRSSVKDGELYDIEATTAIRKGFLKTALATAQLEAGRRKKIIADNWTTFKTAYDKKSVLNAAEVDKTMPPTKVVQVAKPSSKPATTAPTLSPAVPKVVSRTPQKSTGTPRKPSTPKKPGRPGQVVNA